MNDMQKFVKRSLIERYAVVMAWLRTTRISFEILRSVQVSVRGSRSPFYRKEFEVVSFRSLITVGNCIACLLSNLHVL